MFSFSLARRGQCNNNRISTWPDVDNLMPLTKLETVYLEGNPISKDARYRARVKQTLPWLKQIDAVPAVR